MGVYEPPLRDYRFILHETLGFLWLVSPAAVFGLAVAMSFVSLILAFMVPRHPEEGNETVFTRRLVATPAE